MGAGGRRFTATRQQDHEQHHGDREGESTHVHIVFTFKGSQSVDLLMPLA
jgi:hypothetical protein